MMSQNANPLLTQDDHCLLMIDHQAELMLTIRSHESVQTVNNASFLAEAAKIWRIPTLVTTGFVDRNPIFEPLATIVEDAPHFDRTTLNCWDDERIRNWVKEQGKPRIVMAGQWTEVCLLFPTLSALADGYEVYIVTDASGGATKEAHDMATQRMIQAGAIPLTTWTYASELQKDWGRGGQETEQITDLFIRRGGAFGLGLFWQQALQSREEGAR